MLLVESVLVVIAVAIALIYPTIGEGWFGRAEQAFCRVAERRRLSVILVGATAMALRIALLPVLPMPEPIVHDEFGYVLMADTFAHGHLTNPTHPMWAHFESFSILQKPSYQCYAQPAQGLFLALGQLLLGHPFWGVWLSAGAMCAAICWMLQGWLPARWALLGGLIAVLRYGTTTYWADSYWGGAVGALGGALALGALPRIKNSQRIRDAVIMGAGLAILANSRPFEGFVLSLPLAVALLVWIAGKESPSLGMSLRRVVLPLGVVLVVCAFAMGYYCWRVTGNPLQMPYQAERQQYGVAPYLLWQHLRPQPVYHSELMKQMYAQDEVVGYEFYGSWIGELAKVWLAWRFYLGAALTLPLAMMAVALPYGFSWKDVGGTTRFFLLACGITLAGMALETFYSPHYSSPATCVVLVLLILAMIRLRPWRWRERPSGVFLTRAVPIICLVLFLARAIHGPFHTDEYYAQAWYQQGAKSFGRSAMLNRLEQLDGKQLVIVHYRPDHILFDEWVYNERNIDAAKVVWARELTPGENAQLLQHFKDRRCWLLMADEQPPELTQCDGHLQITRINER